MSEKNFGALSTLVFAPFCIVGPEEPARLPLKPETATHVPDEVTVDMVRDWLRGIGKDTRIVFDGFPRTVAQADELDALLGEFGRKVESVILIDAPRDELLRRLTKRSLEQGRTDDTPAVIGRRLDIYKEQTQPVVDHYQQKALVHLVDGLGAREDVTKRLRKAMAE